MEVTAVQTPYGFVDTLRWNDGEVVTLSIIHGGRKYWRRLEPGLSRAGAIRAAGKFAREMAAK